MVNPFSDQAETDAEDVTQEILIKLTTKLSTYEGRSSFRTWLYRIAVNHVLNIKRRRVEEPNWSLAKYGDGPNSAPDEELPDPKSAPADLGMLVAWNNWFRSNTGTGIRVAPV